MEARAYYNENNQHCAEWTRNLIRAGLIAPGDVDDRDIRDVCANDLKGYTQHHFFAGIGIWSLALRMAGWPDDRPVSTGSCPCQPFSQAGKGDGFDDERHLWPAWHWLIQQYRPDTIFGEQVEGKDGRVWLDLVSADMETLAYTFAPVVLPVAGLGAPNQRHRFFWVANPERGGRARGGPEGDGAGATVPSGELGGLGNAGNQGLSHAEPQGTESPRWRREGRAASEPSGPRDPWRELEWIACTDGRQRPTKPALFPLALRHPGDVAVIRAAGNAISPQVAAEVIRAYMDVRGL